MDDLLKGLSMFQDGLQKLAVGTGISNATQQLEAVNNSQASELEKRKVKQQMAQDLAMKLSAVGAPASQIQSAVGSFAPPAIKDANEAYTQAVATGDADMMKMAKNMQGFESKVARDSQSSTQAFTAKENALNRENSLVLAGMKNSKGQTVKNVPEAQLEKITALDNTVGSLRSIKTQLGNMKSEVGPWAGIDITKSWTNPEFGNFKAEIGRAFDQYRKDITGAGASNEELKVLQANYLSIKDTPELLEGKLNTLEEMATKVKARRIKNLGAAGFKTEGLEALQAAEAAPKTEGTPVTVKMKDGSLVKAIKLPSGKIVKPKS